MLGRLTVVALGITLAVLFVRLQRSVIYMARVPERSREYVLKPTVYGITDYLETEAETNDGIKLQMYIIPARSPSGEVSKFTLIYCHSNAGNMGHRISMARAFVNGLKLNVAMFSYRGYGTNEGSPSEKGLKFDVKAVVKKVRSIPDYKDTNILVYGQSIGGAVASYAASNIDNIKGLILENTFYSLERVSTEIFKYISFLMKYILIDKWYTNKEILNIPDDLPVLIIHGTDDTFINGKHSEDLYNLLSNSRKKFNHKDQEKGDQYLKVERVPLKGDHNDTCLNPEYIGTIRNFLLRNFPDMDKQFLSA